MTDTALCLPVLPARDLAEARAYLSASLGWLLKNRAGSSPPAASYQGAPIERAEIVN